MNCVNESDMVVVRLDPGGQVLDPLAVVRDELDIEHGFLTDIGAVDAVTLGHYDVDDQEYLEEESTGQFEVTSFLGNIGPDKIHMHIQVGTRGFEMLGGYCSGACVSGTSEMVIHLGETPLTHHLDERIGLDVFDIWAGPDRAEPDWIELNQIRRVAAWTLGRFFPRLPWVEGVASVGWCEAVRRKKRRRCRGVDRWWRAEVRGAGGRGRVSADWLTPQAHRTRVPGVVRRRGLRRGDTIGDR